MIDFNKAIATNDSSLSLISTIDKHRLIISLRLRFYEYQYLPIGFFHIEIKNKA